MSSDPNTQKVRVTYDTVDAFFESGNQVNQIIEKATGHPVIQTKSLPPFIVPQDLSQTAIGELKAISGVKVETLNEDY